MVTYQYRCADDGLVEVRLPMGTAAPRERCPACGTDAERVYSAPLLSLAPRRLVAAIDKSEQTADTPEVVTSLPPRAVSPGARRAMMNPALRRLPRP
jgi:putative FmdB family regulatory protein